MSFDLEAPSWLGEAGKRCWVLLSEVLKDEMRELDQFALEAACGHYDAMITALKTLNEDGPVRMSRDKFGEELPVKHPAAQVARDNSMAFKAWCIEFGLTPKSRKQLAFDLDKQADTEAALID